MKNRYLLWFANEHTDFRFPEILSLLKLLKLKMQIIDKRNSPFWIVEFPNESEAHLLAARSVSLRSIIRLWGSGQTLEELHNSTKTYPKEIKRLHFHKDLSFRVDVTTFNKTFTMKEKVDKIEMFDYLKFEGPVNLRTPDNIFHYIEDYGMDPNKAPLTPFYYYFGLWVCDGQRNLIHQLSLKTRKFIGNTSMDAQISIMMANMACVTSGSLVLDPFAGSGSLLVAAAKAGGYVLGADIDYLMLHGKTRPTRKQTRDIPRQEESILANMKQYGLSSHYLDAIVADSSLPLWREGLKFDAIITDPPYGVREATERIGSLRQYSVDAEHTATHVPSKVEYTLTNLFKDLLRLAASRLAIGGRLVFFLPVPSLSAASAIPQHAALELIAVSEQKLSANTARRLLTYEKVRELNHMEPEIPFLFPGDFRRHNFTREETRKEKAAREKSTRLDRITNKISTKKRIV